MKQELKSSAQKVGKEVDQILFFKSGLIKTVRGVLTETIEQGQFTKYWTSGGYMCNVNTKEVDFFETHPRNLNNIK